MKFSDFIAGFKQKDKQLHAAAGFVIGFLFSLVSPLLGVVMAIIAGIGKEIYDKVSKKGTPEFLDFVFTVLGGLLGVLNYWLIYWFFAFLLSLFIK